MTCIYIHQQYEWSLRCELVPGGGGSSNGRLWKVILVEREPGCGSVARPIIRFEGCSLVLTLALFALFVDFLSKLGRSPSKNRSCDDVK